jgi:hypothetical protein
MGTCTYSGGRTHRRSWLAVTEIAIALDRPALTPEVRAWINNHPAKRRPVLTRGHSDMGRGAVLLRMEVEGSSEAEVQDEVESLLTDLRMLGLRPKLLDRDVA